MSLKENATHYSKFGGKRRNISSNPSSSVAGDELINDTNYYMVYDGTNWKGEQLTTTTSTSTSTTTTSTSSSTTTTSTSTTVSTSTSTSVTTSTTTTP